MTSRVFSTADFARVAGIREARALEYLQQFEESGVVEQRWSGCGSTPRGLRISRALALATPARRAT